jgi:hypothetical protein
MIRCHSFIVLWWGYILSSTPQQAAHLIAKLQAGICRGTGNGSIGKTRHQSQFASPPGADDIAHRFTILDRFTISDRLAILVRRPGQQFRAGFFGARIVGILLRCRRKANPSEATQ